MSESTVKNSAVIDAFEDLCAQTVKTGQGYLEQAIAASQILARAASAEQASAVAAFNSFVNAYRANAEAFVPLATNLFTTPIADVQFKELFGSAVEQVVESSKDVAAYAAGLLEREAEVGKALAQPAAKAAEASVDLVKSAALQGGAVAEWLAASVPGRAKAAEDAAS